MCSQTCRYPLRHWPPAVQEFLIWVFLSVVNLGELYLEAYAETCVCVNSAAEAGFLKTTG